MSLERTVRRKSNGSVRRAIVRRMREREAMNVQYQAKYTELMDEYKKIWIKEVNFYVHPFFKILSLFCPPALWILIFNTIVKRDDILRFQNWVTKRAWPKWIKATFKWASSAGYNVLKFVAIDWLLFFRKIFRTWGVRKVIYKSGNKYTMDIYYFKERVYSVSKEIKL